MEFCRSARARYELSTDSDSDSDFSAESDLSSAESELSGNRSARASAAEAVRHLTKLLQAPNSEPITEYSVPRLALVIYGAVDY